MAAPPPLSFPHLDGVTILVVDDDNDSLEVLSTFVIFTGADVLRARSAMAALAYLDTAPKLDLVITDLAMPDIDGLEFVRRLRRHPRRSDLPVIALTAFYEAHPNAVEFDAWLKKPVNFEELSSIIRSLLERGDAPG